MSRAPSVTMDSRAGSTVMIRIMPEPARACGAPTPSDPTYWIAGIRSTRAVSGRYSCPSSTDGRLDRAGALPTRPGEMNRRQVDVIRGIPCEPQLPIDGIYRWPIAWPCGDARTDVLHSHGARGAAIAWLRDH